MRIAIALFLAAALAGGCGKKKSPASPANAAPTTESAPAEGGDVKDEAKPDDQDDASKLGADPCDGGE